MDAQYYLDIRIIDSHDDADLKLPVLRNQVYSILHGVFREIPNTFALALVPSKRLQKKMQDFKVRRGHYPYYNFDILRVFSTSKDDLNELLVQIKGLWKIRDYTVLFDIKPVPTAKIKSWSTYQRFRIPTLKSDPPKNTKDWEKSFYFTRLERAKKLPYFIVNSQSTRQRFTVNVEILAANHAGVGVPDSYGLARKNNSFALPNFDVE